MKVDMLDFYKLSNFDNHKLVIYFADNTQNFQGYIAIHRGGIINPAFGATRLWDYDNSADALNDVLKLSHIMTYKSAMAGLKYGGAKAVIIKPKAKNLDRKKLLISYSNKVNCLKGSFITGADVGINDNDMKILLNSSPYIVGESSDPVFFTALGVFYGIQVSLKEVFGTESLENRTFAIQGLGKTGASLLKRIYNEAKEIYVSDIDSRRVKAFQKEFPKIKPVGPLEIKKQSIDVFSPCALSNEINNSSLEQFKCSIIAGSANSQLEDDQIGQKLHKLGILYAPDYIINAGGLIAVVDEFENKGHDETRVLKKVAYIKTTLRKVFSSSKTQKKPSNLVADTMAKQIALKFK